MEQKFIEREWNENIEGELDEDGFFTTPNGSFWDPDYVYFNREGYDKHGGYYDENDIYVPGKSWDEENHCYSDEIEDSFESCSEEFFVTKNYNDDILEKQIEEEGEEEGEMDEDEIEYIKVYDDNEKKDSNNSIENFHLFCNEHNSNEIVGLCVDNNCKNNKLMCSDCIFQYHVKHDIIRIKDVLRKYINLCQKIDNIKNELNVIISEKKKEIIEKINEIIDNLFNNCVKFNEMNDYLKIENDLKNINTRYKNSSNLHNQQKLADSLFQFWKLYSQENNKQIEILSKMNNKLNQNFNKFMDRIEKKLLNINLDD